MVTGFTAAAVASAPVGIVAMEIVAMGNCADAVAADRQKTHVTKARRQKWVGWNFGELLIYR